MNVPLFSDNQAQLSYSICGLLLSNCKVGKQRHGCIVQSKNAMFVLYEHLCRHSKSMRDVLVKFVAEEDIDQIQ